MNYLKIVAPGWAGYNGLIGQITFRDGMSVEPVPQAQADRITGVLKFVEVDAEGNEIGHAGAAQRLIQMAAERAPVRALLARQTDAERRAEELADAIKHSVPPVEVFYTKAQLEEIAEKGGMKALRAVAEPWQVKNRSIPALIEEILGAQAKFLQARDSRIQKATEPAEEEPAVELSDADKLKALAEQIAAAVGDDDVSKQAVLEALAQRIRSAESLYGSSVLSSTYTIGGAEVQLGDIVRGAFVKFGGTVAEWNDLAENDREDLLRLELDGLLAAAE